MDNLLVSAVESNNVRILGVILSGPITEGETNRALLLASRGGHQQAAKCLLEAGADVNSQDVSGQSCLYLAVKGHHNEVTRLLCQSGAHVNTSAIGGITALHWAAKYGCNDCLETLISFGAQLNTRDSSGSTALIQAVRHKQYLAIHSLIAAGCDVRVRDGEGRTALHYGSHTGVAVEALIRAGSDVNMQDKHGATPLIMAASEGLDSVVSSLCHTPGCHVNIANSPANKTPLHILARKGHVRAVNDLLVCGADVNALDCDECSPLWWAVSQGKVKVVVAILMWPQLEDSCQGVKCPVREAVAKQRYDIIKVLIMSGYDHSHMRVALDTSDAKTTFDRHKMSEWIDLSLQVPALRELSRKRLRHHLGAAILDICTHFQLPDKIVKYLCLKELEHYNEL